MNPLICRPIEVVPKQPGMPPKLADDTPLAFSVENPRRAGSKDLNQDGKLAADLKKHKLDASIDLEIILPDGFPMEPPFARVLYPQLRGGYVFERGGICFEPLTPKGWVPSMTLPALAIAIKGILDYGEVRVAGVGNKATRTVPHYTEEGARKDHTAISASHRGGESSTYGSIKHYSS
ncbi:unnamed protein product [Effrenium voratum]|uniref:UBC core domain-containing protein n=1 Tax=Effrenium voratum TaxID=2562239 RepID=A0AA36JAQ8_9DINO|nr:unnamed protein product [Effrenium voratum]CAJ1401578.1 unnamed protein product [Effrenium voratum]CAJ1452829.1 unnamed protein product [Effrenium voratum]